MKKITLITTAVLFTLNVFSQAPNWQWAHNNGGSHNDYVTSVTTDLSGNSYVTGDFYSTSISFGSTILTNFSITQYSDIFVVKYDPNGNVIWAKSAGGTDYELVHSVTTDAFGNVYVAGEFQSDSISFGSITLYNTSTNWDAFIVKYDSNGNLLWAKSAGGLYDDTGYSVTIDAAGNAIVVGTFQSDSITFAGITLYNPPPAGGFNIFLVKYDSNGNVLWANGDGSCGFLFPYSVCLDNFGNIYVTGFFSSNMTFSVTTLLNGSYNSTLLVKYDSNGNSLWARTTAAGTDNYAYSGATDALGNVYMAGAFSNPTITFGSITLTNAGGTSGTSDLFVVKYDSNGNALWAQRAGGADNDEAKALTIAPSGYVYVAGSFHSPTINLGGTILTNAGTTAYSDLYFVKYDFMGNIIWAKGATGGIGNEVANSVITDVYGNIYIAGYIGSPTVTFGTSTLTLLGGTDVLLAKLSNDCFAYYTTTYDSIQNSFTLNVDSTTSATAVAYHWDFGDGTTSTIPNPSHTYTVDTVYNVCMKIYTAIGDSCEYCHIIGKDYLGNIYRSPGFTLNVLNPIATVGVSQNVLKESTVTISPNPFTNQTTITFNDVSAGSAGSPSATTHNIKITDVLGNIVRQLTTNNRQQIIDMSGYAKGVYFVEVTSASSATGVVYRKMVKN